MTLRQYFIIMSLATVLCWVSWFVVVVEVDPFQSQSLGFIFFYVSLFFSLLGIFSLFIFLLHYFFAGAETPMFRLVQKSFREAVLLGLAITGIVYLQGANLLTVWNTGLLLVLLALIILYRLHADRSHSLRGKT